MENTQNFQSLYNARLIAYAMNKRGWDPKTTADHAGIAELSVNKGLVGTLRTLAKLRKLTDALGVKWEYITRLDLQEDQFHRAVVGSRAGR